VYLPVEVSAQRAERITAFGSEVIRVKGTYEDAVQAAKEATASDAGLLIPDTSDDPSDRVVNEVMGGYALIVSELAIQLSSQPSHAFVQAGASRPRWPKAWQGSGLSPYSS
jgi:diaminopropionate ammonia-lyase